MHQLLPMLHPALSTLIDLENCPVSTLQLQTKYIITPCDKRHVCYAVMIQCCLWPLYGVDGQDTKISRWWCSVSPVSPGAGPCATGARSTGDHWPLTTDICTSVLPRTQADIVTPHLQHSLLLLINLITFTCVTGLSYDRLWPDGQMDGIIRVDWLSGGSVQFGPW